MIYLCDYCGHEIPRKYSKRQHFCCDHCRRKFQDERRKEERLEERHRKEMLAMMDPWQRSDVDAYAIDGFPIERGIHDQCEKCPYRDIPDNEVICEMCRDGAKV